MPESLGRVHPRYLTPHVSTILMGVLSIVWYVGLTLISEDILFDSIAALGLMIAFYYGLTGLSCTVYYRRELFKSVRNFFALGVLPMVGFAILGYVFVKECIDLAKPANSESGNSWFGVGPPLIIGAGALIVGGILILIAWSSGNDFFKRKPELADPHLLDEEPPPPPSPTPPPPAPAAGPAA
jgi:amino acid transporter